MFKEMRRKDRKLKDEEIIKIIKDNNYGVLSTISDNGYPYGVPVSYVYFNNAIYFHGAQEGHKLDNISINNKVSFCVVGKTFILPDKFTTNYESVIAFGEAEEVDEDEKNEALLEIIKKYSPDFIESGKVYISNAGAHTKVVKINIEEISGKARK